jgi:hypothetical protein
MPRDAQDHERGDQADAGVDGLQAECDDDRARDDGEADESVTSSVRAVGDQRVAVEASAARSGSGRRSRCRSHTPAAREPSGARRIRTTRPSSGRAPAQRSCHGCRRAATAHAACICIARAAAAAGATGACSRSCRRCPRVTSSSRPGDPARSGPIGSVRLPSRPGDTLCLPTSAAFAAGNARIAGAIVVNAASVAARTGSIRDRSPVDARDVDPAVAGTQARDHQVPPAGGWTRRPLGSICRALDRLFGRARVARRQAYISVPGLAPRDGPPGRGARR